MGVRGSLVATKLGEPVILDSQQVGGFHRKLNNISVILIQPLPNTEEHVFRVPLIKGSSGALTHISPEARPIDYIHVVDKPRCIIPVITRSTLDPKIRTFYSRNYTFEGNNRCPRKDWGSHFYNHTASVIYNQVHHHSHSPLSDPLILGGQNLQ